jgi:starch phosphorylase
MQSKAINLSAPETETTLQPESQGATAELHPHIPPAVFRQAVLDHVHYTCVKELNAATAGDLYRAMANAVRDRLVQRWLDTQRTHVERQVKRAYYFSSEFLTGRSLGLCLLNLGLYGVAERIAAERGLDLDDILESEVDPGLGNGGLGRLAACFMDSLATLDFPAVGYGIRYEYGIFEQSIDHGQQVERPDEWLQYGNPWELPRHEHAQRVRLYGRVQQRRNEEGRLEFDWVDTKQVIGVPHDSFIVGHNTGTVNTLRLWVARSTRDFDLALFNQGDFARAVEEKVSVENISKVLYPNDATAQGKELRLMQQYFFVACSIADIVRSFKQTGQPWEALPDYAAIQLNDTHPAVAIAELMRVLIDQQKLDWDSAWAITQRIFGYTNHTLLPEALERWPLSLFERLLPRHMLIIYDINQHFLREVQRRWPGDVQRLRRMSIIEEQPVRQVRMAHLATIGSHSINGVAKLHSELLKRELLRDFFELWPERFNNKTNGITPRRWLLYANPRLARLISQRLGNSWLPANLPELARLREHADDPLLLDALRQIKLENKRRLASIVHSTLGTEIDPAALFIVQTKRIHEYKRQLLACLGVITHYLRLKQQPQLDCPPRVYVFSGKAAAGYFMAKLYIRLINDVAETVNADPETRQRLQVVFMPDYSVTLAQAIIPAADLSLQISQAGTEASGTGNMKFALNGALTLGTLDGANVELRDAVGYDNFFLFGLDVQQVQALRGQYDPQAFIAASRELERAVALLDSDFFCLGDPRRYAPVVEQLRVHDPYMVCADYAAYVAAERTAATLFANPREWARRALFNIAGASAFSSDATINAYADEIWHIRPQKVEFQTAREAKRK